MLTTTAHSFESTHTRGAAVRLLVAIPALNEEATIKRVIDGIPDCIEGIDLISAVVVDDGSTDSTAQLAREAGAVVLRHHNRKGVGAAFATALSYAIEQGVDLIATIDADGQFNPADIPALVAPIVADEADFVTASRFIDPAMTPEMPWIKRWGNHRMSHLVSSLTGGKFYDVSCGMRCYSRKAMLNLNLLGEFTYTQEVFLNLAFKHLRIVEIPIPVRGERKYGKSRVANSILQYAVQSSKIILRAYRDYRPMHLFGGIALLLLIPAALFGGFLMIHYLMTGNFTPYKWTGFTAGTLGVLGLVMLHMGMLGDMLNRHRLYLEELLAETRRASGKNRLAERPFEDEANES